MSTSDKTPILEDVTINIEEEKTGLGDQKYENHHTGFKTRVVGKLAKPLMGIGIASFGLGVLLCITASFIRCEPHCYGGFVSEAGYGLWCGLVFLGVGYFLTLVVKKVTLCRIVTAMAITASSTVFAILMIVLSIFAMVRDKNYYEWEEPGPAYNRWENEDFAGRHHSITRSRTSTNVGVFLPNLLLTFLGFATLAILLVVSGLSCQATCCNYNPKYLQISLFEPVTASEIEEDRQAYSQPIMQAAPTYYVPQGFGGSNMQPVIMMPGGNSASPYQTFKLVPVSSGDPPAPSGDTSKVANET